ncbi:hypothetical protein LIP55_06300 [[Ruminococcus] gnavus]|nr:hypothetical protein [Mediterraneibacter gnavus]
MQKIHLEHAESMLEHTDKTVDEIMHTVGYNNKGYFYKIFQQKYSSKNMTHPMRNTAIAIDFLTCDRQTL